MKRNVTLSYLLCLIQCVVLRICARSLKTVLLMRSNIKNQEIMYYLHYRGSTHFTGHELGIICMQST